MRSPAVLVALAAALLLSACSVGNAVHTGAVVAMSDPKTAEITLADVAAARDSALRWNDTLAVTCYDYLLVRLPELGLRGTTDVKGAVSAFQKARNAVKASQEGLSPEFKVACGPLYMDAKGDIRGLASMFAGVGVGL
jgi:hypothetical protein